MTRLEVKPNIELTSQARTPTSIIDTLLSVGGSNSRGFNSRICADRSRASGQGRDQLNLFSTIAKQYSLAFCPIGDGLFQPSVCKELSFNSFIQCYLVIICAARCEPFTRPCLSIGFCTFPVLSLDWFCFFYYSALTKVMRQPFQHRKCRLSSARTRPTSGHVGQCLVKQHFWGCSNCDNVLLEPIVPYWMDCGDMKLAIFKKDLFPWAPVQILGLNSSFRIGCTKSQVLPPEQRNLLSKCELELVRSLKIY